MPAVVSRATSRALAFDMPPAAILDLDGTLVDTNYHHALAWYRAFREHDIVLPMWRLHRHVGMGGDKYVAALAGDDVEERLGENLRERWEELFNELIAEVEPLEGAREFVVELKERGHRVVLASSSIKEHFDQMVEKLGVSEAARKAGIETITVMTGGFSEDELREAGAVAVFESMNDLRERLEETPLGQR